MVMASSARSAAICLIFFSSAVRSWLPGWYCRTGSLAGTGTLLTASMTAPSLLLFGCWEATRLCGSAPDTARAAPYRHVNTSAVTAASRAPIYGLVEELEFLGRVPEEFVPFGAVHREAGVVVSVVRGGERGHRGAHVIKRVQAVDVTRRHVGERDGTQDLHGGGVVAGAADVILGDLSDQDDAARGRVRILGQQPQ